MLSGKPLFPGRDYHHQLTLILDVLGTPTLDEFYAITTRRSRDYIRALPFRKRRPFAQLFPNASALAVDFLTKTLTFDPKKRITVEQALAHPYLEAYHDPDDEPVAPPLDPEFFEFDLHKDDISREQLKGECLATNRCQPHRSRVTIQNYFTRKSCRSTPPCNRTCHPAVFDSVSRCNRSIDRINKELFCEDSVFNVTYGGVTAKWTM